MTGKSELYKTLIAQVKKEIAVNETDEDVTKCLLNA